MILLIDNYDSFTYNIYQLMSVLGAEVEVRRNDDLTLETIREMKPDGIVISPGPGDPSEAGISCETIREFAGEVPILGVCLGMQCIGAVYGGTVIRAPQLMHGKTGPVFHESEGVLDGVPSPFQAVRYHSLAVERSSLPADLEVTGEAPDGTIMALRHRQLPVEGVQFHPESVLTAEGPKILRNFLDRC